MPPRRCLPALFAASACLFTTGISAAEKTPSPEQIRFFEREVRPVLATHCYKCHGADKQKGGLRLDSIAAAVAGGESGAAVVPGKPEESLLVDAINHGSFEMPPTGKLKDAEIDALTAWVKMGAPWPGGDEPPPAAVDRSAVTDEDRAFWSFQPVADPPVPNVEHGGWARNPIDHFIFDRLRAEELGPAPEADRVALIRRITFDLTGLPPTPEEVAAFAADPDPLAYEKLVDRLLESPRYGERWARHWLDLVRYADSDGYRQDAYRPNAWRYRDYVIQSFNDDKPYDRFVLEQLAGDEIAPHDPDVVVATGFLRHWPYEYNQRDVVGQWTEILNDVTDVTGDVLLGMGVGCARCHDHKFDPIPQKDYFRLQAFFAPLLPRDDLPLATPEQVAKYEADLAAWEATAAEIRAKVEAIEGPARKKAEDQQVAMFPPEIQEMMRKPVGERTPYEHQLAELAHRQVINEWETRLDTRIPKEQKPEWEALRKELGEHEKRKPAPLPKAVLVSDAAPTAPPVVIPGDRKGEELEPAFLTVLGGDAAKPEPLPTSTGRRTALARWITSPDNPLSTRVIVNRVWQHHFGRGLVATSSDFGRLGEPPSHPELLDWLTSRFLVGGWRFKSLHRLLLTSAAYRQSAFHPEAAACLLRDPENRLLWRWNTKRLAGEQIRDAMLAASGELDLAPGGPAVDPSRPRRAIFTKQIRNTPDPLLYAFDTPEGYGSVPERNVTTTPTQSLLMINGEWTLERAKSFAARLRKSAASDSDAATAAYRLALAREPAPADVAAAVGFLDRQRQGRSEDALGTPVAGAMPHREGASAFLQPDSRQPRLAVAGTPLLPSDAFTIEAFVLLESVYPDGSVRTIASQWDDRNDRSGWSLGVTSAGSSYTPRNLILQFVGPDATGKTIYEVVPSFLHLDLNRPYYVGASVRFEETGEAGVTFYLKDLSDNDAPLQVVGVRHNVVGPVISPSTLLIGGRDATAKHSWHGLIDDVRLSAGALTPDRLLLEREGTTPETVGYWRFEAPDFFADSSGRGLALQVPSASAGSAEDTALADLCHVLLNANEFLYVD